MHINPEVKVGDMITINEPIIGKARKAGYTPNDNIIKGNTYEVVFVDNKRYGHYRCKNYCDDRHLCTNYGGKLIEVLIDKGSYHAYNTYLCHAKFRHAGSYRNDGENDIMR